MEYRRINKGVFSLVLCVVVLLAVCVFAASCGNNSVDLNSASEAPWTFPPDEDDDKQTKEEQTKVFYGSDNVIDFGQFDTNAVTNVTVSDSDAPHEDETHEHVVSEFDGYHDFPGEEFDPDAYETLELLESYTIPAPKK